MREILKKKEIERPWLCETTTLCFRGRWIRLECVRAGTREQGSTIPGVCHARLRDLDTDAVISTCMEGFPLPHAFIHKDVYYVFATDYWGIYMSRSFDLTTWSQPMLVLHNDHSEVIHHQNNTICRDGDRFVMAVDLLGGPYNFTICFAQSRDLQTWSYIPGAIYRPHLYTSCPNLYFVDGWYHLIHVKQRPDAWFFEVFDARSRDLLVWEDAPEPVLTPDTALMLDSSTPGEAPVPACNVSDLNLFEREGKTVGYFHVGTQLANVVTLLQRGEYDGTLAEFFAALYGER